jgi:hypothetical protein
MRSLGAAATSRPLLVGVCSNKASSKERERERERELLHALARSGCNVEASDCRCVYETLSY